MYKRLAIISLILLICASIFTVWIYRSVLALPQVKLALPEETILEVPKGYSASRLVTELTEQGWLDDPLRLKLLFRLRPELTQLKAGEYKISANITLGALLDQLREGRSVQYAITLIEGSTVKEVLTELKRNKQLVQTLSANNAIELARELGFEPYTTSEGLFLAETYYFDRGTTDRELLLRASTSLDVGLTALWAERNPELPLESPYEALTLASIIEKETGLASERAVISGVFVRRLNKGMRLQTDPTVIYGLGDRYTGNITRQHLKQKTPYNTYRIDGLPPSPIAIVGLEAIKAALNPAPGTALYFVAKGDGSHQFSDTLKQHNSAVREYQLKRRSDYRSAPELK